MIVDIVVVVHPSGAGGSKDPGSEWELVFHGQPWKPIGEQLADTELRITKPVPETDLDAWMDRVKPYQVLNLRVDMPGAMSENARLLDILGPSDDAEMLAASEELQQVVTYVDPILGEFVLDRAVNWYESRVAWSNGEVDLRLSVDDCDDVDALFQGARRLAAEQTDWDRRLREAAAGQLLNLKNENWLDKDEGEEPVTADQFQSRVAMQSISVYPDGSLEFWFEDGDLFFGHAILIDANVEGSIGEAHLAG
jgi:hypothetical protein